MGKTPELIDKLIKFGIKPNTKLGQHMLVDENVVEIVADQVHSGSNVLEIGSGPGNLTDKIASKAHMVVGIEIDRRYQPLLDDVQNVHPNVQIIYGDALSVNYLKILKGKDPCQIVSDLPFHISEPFLPKIIDLPIDGATLVVGDQLARKMQIENPDNPEFSKTSLLTQTFFEVDKVSEINKNAFYPQPRTNATLVNLTPRENDKLQNPGRKVLRNLFLSESRNPTIAKIINESTDNLNGDLSQLPKPDYQRQTRRQLNRELRDMIRRNYYGPYPQGNRQRTYHSGETEKIDLPNDLLSTPFSRLDNHSIRELTVALRKRYGEY